MNNLIYQILIKELSKQTNKSIQDIDFISTSIISDYYSIILDISGFDEKLVKNSLFELYHHELNYKEINNRKHYSGFISSHAISEDKVNFLMLSSVFKELVNKENIMVLIES